MSGIIIIDFFGKKYHSQKDFFPIQFKNIAYLCT